MTKELGKKIKESLNLPKTSFPMRASLSQKEPETIKFWEEMGLYQKMMAQKSKESFVLPDGPPYANGHLHVGHALNKILKDIIFKYKNSQGIKTPFVPGWDTHGLPIELNVYKKHKLKDSSKKEIRELCRQEALHWIEIQKKEFIRLGVLGDWKKPYLTMSPEYEAKEVQTLFLILKRGLLYQGYKPVFWCTKLQTALAHSEVEYKEHRSPSIYVKFEVQKLGDASLKQNIDLSKTFFIIWTTTPWTLPANTGIAVNAQLEYGIYQIEEGCFKGEFWIIATGLQESVEKECSVVLKKCHTIKGAQLERSISKNPLLERQSLCVLGDHVSLDAGTGCVHTAPAHGLDDFIVGQKYNLPMINPVDAKGRYTEEFKKYQNESIWDVNMKIVEDLKSTHHLVTYKDIEHSYPFGARSKAPLIFRATPQWFIKVNDEKSSLKEKALQWVESGKIQFTPEWGGARFKAMISTAPDWCVSRQRTWGVPLPIFYCQSCEKPLLDEELLNTISKAMVTRGLEAYFDKLTEEWTKGYQCECGHDQFRRGEDILDVWFDSGVYHIAFQKQQTELPADIYIEGSDQHRGWFYTSLLSSLAVYEKPPFKRLITHGFVVDAKGNKMSKSAGNVMFLSEIIKNHGAEILRLWVAHEDYFQDLSISTENIKRVTETYRKIRNSIRFLIGNLEDFNFKKDHVYFDSEKDLKKSDFKATLPFEERQRIYYSLLSMEGLVLAQLQELIKNCTAHYEEYNFYKVYHELNSFFVRLSSEYLDIMKDRLYTSSKNGLLRRATQTVLYILLDKLSLLMSPILSFLAEEIHAHLKSKDPLRPESIFLISFPKEADVPCMMPPQNKEIFNKSFKDFQEFSLYLSQTFKMFFEFREKLYKVIEEMRAKGDIGSSLEIELCFYTKNNTIPQQVLELYLPFLREFFIVSHIGLKTYTKVDEFKDSSQYILLQDDIFVSLKKTKNKKCPRCWSYDELQLFSSWEAHICTRCITALT